MFGSSVVSYSDSVFGSSVVSDSLIVYWAVVCTVLSDITELVSITAYYWSLLECFRGMLAPSCTDRLMQIDKEDRYVDTYL